MAALRSAARGHGRNAALLAWLVVLGTPADAAARQERGDTAAPPPQARADTTPLTPQEEVLRRLRAQRPVGRVDTAALRNDTLPPERGVTNVQFEGAAPRQRGTDATSGIAYDSVMTELLQLRGYTATEYLGGKAFFESDSARLQISDQAVVVRDGQKLTADSTLIFWERRSLACGYGRPVFSGRGVDSPVESDSMCYDIDRGLGLAMGAETTLREGAEWRVRGNVYFDPGGGSAYGHDAIFTDCDEPFPHVHYHFAAKHMKVSPNNVLVARDVTLNFADVPVFWLPFFVQSLAEGRRSGLLMPRFGINDIARSSPRYNRRIEDIGFYWAISDYLGSEVALDWFSENWTALRGSFDWNHQLRFLRGGVTYRRFWSADGSRQFTVAGRNSWRPDERTTLEMSANYASSSAFIRQNSFDPYELQRSITSSTSLGRRFGWGSINTQVSRAQQLSDNTIDWVLPSIGVSIQPVTFFRAESGEESWYSNATWTGSFRSRLDRKDVDPDNLSLRAQGKRDVRADIDGRFTVGRFSWSQRFDIQNQALHAREFPVDTIPGLPSRSEQRTNWSTSLAFQQRVVGTSSITPTLALSGGTLSSDTTGGETVASPLRMSFGASLNTDVFGFWPGVGPFEAFRHRMSPSFSYSYSPAPTVTDRQREVFAIGEIREQNRITIGLNQTWEARFRQRPDENGGAVGEEADTLATEAADTATGPRRRERGQPITLLSIATDAVVYDFVAAREDGRGVQNTEIGNTLSSDLLRGMQISFAHDLFRPVFDDEGQPTQNREFAPHLSRVSAGFSLNNESWLFRVLGLGGRQPQPTTRRLGEEPPEAQEADEPPTTESDYGLIGSRSRAAGMPYATQPVGTWNATFNYSLARPRDRELASENQMLMANVRFQPTVQWSVGWSTGYSFTTSEFTDHVLTLTRRLHDWDANFDFVRAQNGNFTFMFRVALRANPDIKVDYTQRDSRAGERVPGIR
jgi:hypothetical protein